MAGCCHNPGGMEGKCPPKEVACEFNRADIGVWFDKKDTAEKGRAKKRAKRA